MTSWFYLLPIFVVRWLLTARTTINLHDRYETLFDIFMVYNDDEVNKTHDPLFNQAVLYVIK